MRVERFGGLTETRLIEMFHAQCGKKYQQLDQQIVGLAKRVRASTNAKKMSVMTSRLTKLQRQCEDIARIDYFCVSVWSGSGVTSASAETDLLAGKTSQTAAGHRACNLSRSHLGDTAAAACRPAGVRMAYSAVGQSESGHPLLDSTEGTGGPV